MTMRCLYNGQSIKLVLAIAIIHAVMSPLRNRCSALVTTTLSLRHPINRGGINFRSKSGINTICHTNNFQCVQPSMALSSSCGPDERIRNVEHKLKEALESARSIDRSYGLCTEPSLEAWTVVDDLYKQMQMLQGDGHDMSIDNGRQVQTQPNGRQRVRLGMLSGRAGTLSEKKNRKRRYFF
eukprot:CAMPEP_0183754632 /NCGR_PEP_ID=MMETSP0739-20130205/3637_1 /TAXON_ID=385413 /ORGANISM="Thalassiosira miniscula, Strain CCMP1093" /LENGTH=181 /DNA_ID=CAMNT_0025991269 /DNA_START=129 /DNA_END=674 /DNA_ORIENTATION=+